MSDTNTAYVDEYGQHHLKIFLIVVKSHEKTKIHCISALNTFLLPGHPVPPLLVPTVDMTLKGIHFSLKEHL